MSETEIAVLSESLKGIKIQLDSEFKVLNERINSTNAILERVEEQTKKTNGRVTKLEGEEDNYLNCPNTKDIKEMKENLFEYNIFKKYPKIAVGVIAIACLILIGGTFVAFRDFTEKVKTDLNEVIHNEIVKQIPK